MQNEKLIIFDIDGTLLDGRDDLGTLDAILVSIKRFKGKGVLFGINTSRPLATATGVYEYLGFCGPLIVEDGACYRVSVKDNFICMKEDGKTLQSCLIEGIEGFVKQENLPAFEVVVSDDKKHFLGISRKNIIFVSKNRKYTGSIYIRMKGRVDEGINQRLTKYLDGYINLDKEISWMRNVPEYGKIIIGLVGVDRLETLARISEKYFPRHDVIMISDNETSSTYPETIEFSAVENATDKYKEYCDYVAERSGVLGIEEILSYYLDNKAK